MNDHAVILAGGDNPRLHPLTCSRPAAMLPVCGKTIICRTLDTLRRQGFSHVHIAADRLSNVLKECLDGENANLIVTSPSEESCFPIAEAAGQSDGGDLIAINGSLLFDTDLNAAAAAHKKTGADITVLTVRTDRPSNSSAAAVAKNGKVTSIILTPSHESCASDLAVAGIFILSRSAAEKAKNYGSLLEDYIPDVIGRGGKVMNFTAEGVFIDVDSPEALFAASNAVLEGKLSNMGENVSKKNGRGLPNSYIAKSASIANGAVIGGGTVIGENVTVCRGAKLNGAIVMDGAFIGERATVNGGIIGAGARLLSDSSVFEGAVVGDGAVIDEQAVVRCGVKVWNGKHVEGCASQNVKYGFPAPICVGEDGICGETGSVITPRTAAAAGSALASLTDSGAKIGIGFSSNSASESLALAAAAGAAAAGAEVWLFGAVSAPELAYCTSVSGLTAGCRIDAGVTAKIRLCSGDGLPLSRKEEKVVERGIGGEYRRADFKHFGKIRGTSAITRLYRNMLEKTAPKALNGIRAVLNTPGERITAVCGDILDRISDRDGSPIVFHIGSDGLGTSAYTEETGYVFEEKLILICCTRRFEQGYDIALPYDFPQAADKLAERYGRKVLRYSLCPSDESDREARALALETPFVRDGAALVLSVLETLSAKGMGLAEATAQLPETALASRFVAVSGKPVRMLRKICTDKAASGDGIVLNDKRGRILIRPVKTEKGVIMKAESFSMEAASELCDFYQEKLKMLDVRGEK